jgi:hypothetical protein
MAKKPILHAERVEVSYDEHHWSLLGNLRSQALEVMTLLSGSHLNSFVHGSVARGDVSKKSDIDVFVPESVSSFVLESSLENYGFSFLRRVLVQATPAYALKGYLELAENVCVSFPLVRMRRVERDFYKYGGELNLQMLKNDLRVPGVDKRLMLIEPTSKGHMENSIVGREGEIAKFLDVSVEIVHNRVHTLRRRDEVGRTGVFVEKELAAEETFEQALQRLAKVNPAVRRKLREV